MCSQEASRCSHVGLRSWRNALRLTTILSERMKISSSKGETEISCFFCRFFNSYVIFWVSDHDHYSSRPAFPGRGRHVSVFSSQTQQVSEKQRDCKYTKSVDAEESHGYINLAWKDTKRWSFRVQWDSNPRSLFS